MKHIHTEKFEIGRNPYKDWAGIFIISLCVVVVFVIVGVFTFYNVNESIEEAEQLSSTAAPSFDPATFESAIGVMKSRAKHSRDVLNGIGIAADPSK